MAVPKRRTSVSKRKMRYAGKSLKRLNIAFDKRGDAHLPHCASPAGYYDDKEIFKLRAREKKAG